MVLTPDQKRRIAELDSKAPAEEEKKESPVQPLIATIKGVFLKIPVASWRPLLIRILIIAVVVGAAGYYVREYQLHRVNYGKMLSSGTGNPIDRFLFALKEQKKKAKMLENARAQYLDGEYGDCLATAASVAKMDERDQRAQDLITLSADAAVQRATREFDVGEIEAALADVRLALKYRPEHEEGQQLSLRIGERLYREARAHYSKNEYTHLIRKAKEVIKINPSDSGASNLLMKTNHELLTQADEALYSKRYFEALDKVRLSLQIDPTNPRALRLLEQISLYVETPDIKLRGITKFGKRLYAVVQLPNSSQTTYVKEGETLRNFKLLRIDSEARTATFLQIYTKAEFTVVWSKHE
jgi:tetratricopeptide (TPR) repeat protein